VTPAQRAALDALPPKRRAFVIALVGEAAGNQTEAARIAGYASPKAEGSRLLTFGDVAAAVKAMRVPAERAKVLGIDDLRGLWSDFALDGDVSTRDRLKATELLGKSQGAFVERREVRVTEVPATKEEALARLNALRAKLGGEGV
jgi:phage terminase small subunit